MNGVDYKCASMSYSPLSHVREQAEIVHAAAPTKKHPKVGRSNASLEGGLKRDSEVANLATVSNLERMQICPVSPSQTQKRVLFRSFNGLRVVQQ